MDAWAASAGKSSGGGVTVVDGLSVRILTAKLASAAASPAVPMDTDAAIAAFAPSATRTSPSRRPQPKHLAVLGGASLVPCIIDQRRRLFDEARFQHGADHLPGRRHRQVR